MFSYFMVSGKWHGANAMLYRRRTTSRLFSNNVSTSRAELYGGGLSKNHIAFQSFPARADSSSMVLDSELVIRRERAHNYPRLHTILGGQGSRNFLPTSRGVVRRQQAYKIQKAGIDVLYKKQIWGPTIIRPRFQRLTAQRESLVSCLDALSSKAAHIERF